MKWPFRIFALIALLALFILSAAAFRRAPDPVAQGKPVSAWLEQLMSSDYKARNEAQGVLLEVGERALPQIRSCVRKQNFIFEPYLASVSRHLPFIPYKPSNPAPYREAAANLLAEMGAKGAEAVPDLVEALEHDAGRESVERALRKLGPLAEAGLREGLSDSQEKVRESSAALLREIKAVSPETLEALSSLLEDGAEKVRAEAALTLGILDRKETEPRLRKMLATDLSAIARARSSEALGKLTSIRKDSLKILGERMIHDRDEAVRFQAARALWIHEQDAQKVVPALTALLPTPEGWRATYLLGEIGAEAAPAIPALVEVLKREQVARPFRTPPSSAFALGQIGPAALEALYPVLSEPAARIRVSAVVAIGFMGSHGIAAAPRLVPLLKDHDIEVRHGAAMALGMIGARDNAVIGGLEACLQDEDIYMRSAAADLLRQLAPDREWVVAAE